MPELHYPTLGSAIGIASYSSFEIRSQLSVALAPALSRKRAREFSLAAGCWLLAADNVTTSSR